MSDVEDFKQHFRDRHGHNPKGAPWDHSRDLTHDDLTSGEGIDSIMLTLARTSLIFDGESHYFESSFKDAARGLDQHQADQHKAVMLTHMRETTMRDYNERSRGFDRLVLKLFEAKRAHLATHPPQKSEDLTDDDLTDDESTDRFWLHLEYADSPLPTIRPKFDAVFEIAARGMGEEAFAHKKALIEYMRETTQQTKDRRSDGFNALLFKMIKAKRDRVARLG